MTAVPDLRRLVRGFLPAFLGLTSAVLPIALLSAPASAGPSMVCEYDEETFTYDIGIDLGIAIITPSVADYALANPLNARVDSRLVREAERLGSSHQRSVDALTTQLANGNLNPGIGTRRLFGDVFEARARDGARVYFQQTGDQISVLAKSTKSNQQRVINILEELYG